jgi:hypothetical protein
MSGAAEASVGSHGIGGLKVQTVAEFFWPFSPTGTRTCALHIRGSSRAVSEW